LGFAIAALFIHRDVVKNSSVNLSIGFAVLVILALGFKTKSSEGRILILRYSTELAMKNIIIGNGGGSFEAVYNKFQSEAIENEYIKEGKFLEEQYRADYIKHPLNEFLRLAVEYGLIVSIFFFILLLYTIIKVFRSSKNTYVQILFLSLIPGIIFYNILDIPVFSFMFIFSLFSIHYKRKNSPIHFEAITLFFIILIFGSIFYYNIIEAYLNVRWKSASKLIETKEELGFSKYKKLLEDGYYNTEFIYNYATELFLRKNDVLNSKKLLKRIENKLGNPNISFFLGVIDEQNNLDEAAIVNFRKTVFHSPKKILAKHLLYEIYIKTGQDKEARVWAKEILKTPIFINLDYAQDEIYIRGEAQKYLNGSSKK
jgi:hypothetical protein